jgi:hypothetical protein
MLLPQEIVKNRKFGLSSNVVVTPPVLPALNDENDNTISRLWLANFGLISSLGHCSRIPLDPTQVALELQ